MLNRIVRSDKNQIVTLQVVDELRPVKVQPALQALEKNLASRPAQKVILDLNNLQVLSQPTQELLGLLVRHVRLQNIPISFTGNQQLDPATLLNIAEGKPEFHTFDEEEDDVIEVEPEQAKFFSRFSAPPFFAKIDKTKAEKIEIPKPIIQPTPEVNDFTPPKKPLAPPMVEPKFEEEILSEKPELKTVTQIPKKPVPNVAGVKKEAPAQAAFNQPQTEVEAKPYDSAFSAFSALEDFEAENINANSETETPKTEPNQATYETASKEYKFWFRMGLLILSVFSVIAIVMFIMLWDEFENGSVLSILEEVTQNTETIEKQDKIPEPEFSSPKALAMAVEQGNYREAQRLLDSGVNPEQLDQRGLTPLMRAVQLQNAKMVKLLAKHGANINRSDKLEDTPLVWAASKGDSDIVAILMEFGADPDRGNFTALMWAAFHGDKPMLQKFIEAQANLNARTREGWTALMWASEQGNVQAVWALLEKGARINIQNNDGLTALMLAARKGRLGATNLLLKKGADGYLIDFDKKSALDHAKQFNRKHVILILEKELGK